MHATVFLDPKKEPEPDWEIRKQERAAEEELEKLDRPVKCLDQGSNRYKNKCLSDPNNLI